MGDSGPGPSASKNDEIPDAVPVLIVGGGPVGLLQALLLSRLNVRSLIVERYPQRLGAPKAHAINPRSLEILRQYGLGEKQIRRLGTARADGYWVNFVTSLSGELVGRLPYERMDVAVLDDTPEMIHNIPQPALEEHLTRLIEQDPNITLKKGYSIHGLMQGEDEVVATVKETRGTALHKITAQHLIACDGRKSRVRELLEISSEGEDSDQTMMTVHFSSNLRPVVGDRVGMLHWIMDPIAAGFIIAYDLSGTQVHISEVDTSQCPVESWTEEMCRAKVRAAIGQDVLFDILSFRPWVFRRQIAETFQKGNIFLAGDAAHSFPPTGGLGLNCGLADVHNLAYKIAMVHHRMAAPSILHTYTAERRQIAQNYSKQSVKNGEMIFKLVKSLNMAGVTDIAEARKGLHRALKDPQQREMVDQGIEGQREHFDNLEHHIGYVYGSEKPPAHASHYRPKFTAGARLPHVWISFPGSAPRNLDTIDVSYVKELSAAQASQFQWSTLDLCSPDSFTLILGEQNQNDRFSNAEKHFNTKKIPFNVWRLGQDFSVISQSWFASEIHHGGILVRPDHHILMKIESRTSSEEIISAVENHLGI
ncbi:FAD binding domain-containing protein [Aspergillus unguis]